MRHLDDLESEADGVGLHDLSHLRFRRLRDDDLRPARRVLRDVTRVGGDGGAVVAGGVRDVHSRELADRGLVLEDRLQYALAHLGLVRRVRSEELAALQHRVDDGRHVVVVDACTEERQLPRRRHVPRLELGEMRDELRLGQRRLEIELAAEAHAFGNVAEELLDRRDADRLEHRITVAVGEREERVRHCSASTCRYAATSSSDSGSDGSASRIRTSHPSPYGSSFTVSGASTTFWLISTISPDSGAITSETAFTDSISPYGWSRVIVAPTCGGS